MSGPNPFDDASPFGVVDIGGLRLPGIMIALDGVDTPEEWQVQKATAKSGASTVWKGSGLAESIKITLALANREAYARYENDVVFALRPKRGEKPPALVIVNPLINFNGITRVSCKNVGAPKWQAGGCYWTADIELIEYQPPKPAAAGPPKPGDYSNPDHDPNRDGKQQIEDELRKAAAA